VLPGNLRFVQGNFISFAASEQVLEKQLASIAETMARVLRNPLRFAAFHDRDAC
jgi:hypothetical protein